MRGLGLALAALTLAVSSAAAQAPDLAELPALQGRLREVARALDDRALVDFAYRLSYEESYRVLGLEGVDWDRALTDVRAAVDERPALAQASVELAWRHGASRIAGGRWADARALLEPALAASTAADGRRGWIEASLAQVAAAEERWKDALAHLDRAEAERGRARDAEHLAPWVEGLRAEAWTAVGLPELAEGWLERRFAEVAASGDPNERWSWLDVRYGAWMAADDYEGLRALERFARESGWTLAWDRERLAGLERRFATALQEEGQRSPARNAEALARLDALLADEALSAPDRSWALISAALALLDAGRPAEARARAAELRAWLEARGEADANDRESAHAPLLVALEGLSVAALADAGAADPRELEAALEAAWAAWRTVRAGWADTPARGGGIGYLLLGRRQILVEALLALELRAHGPERGADAALEWLVEAHLLTTLAKRLAVEPCAFDEARERLLGPRRGLVAWVPLRGRSFALAADRERATMLELPPTAELELRARDALAAVQHAVLEPGERSQAELGRALAAARAAFLPEDLLARVRGWDALYAAGLDDVGFVALELLDDGCGRTLGSRLAVAHLPSIPVGLELARRARRAGPADRGAPAVIVVADGIDPAAAAAHAVNPLRVPEDAAPALADALYGLDVRVERGAEASLSALRADGAALWHVVAHGVQRLGERPPGVLLASEAGRDGAAFAEQLEALPAPGLVLLSVCGASRSPLRRGDGGRSDLSAALFVAGATAVGSSFADLDLAPALAAGTRVHRELAAGLPLAEALRRARAALDEGGDRHGREWLAAHLIQARGAALEPALRPRTRGTARAAFALAAVLGLAVLAWRARRPA